MMSKANSSGDTERERNLELWKRTCKILGNDPEETRTRAEQFVGGLWEIC